MMQQPIEVPAFGVGQTDEKVQLYIRASLLKMCSRIGLDQKQTDILMGLASAALFACIPSLNSRATEGYVKLVPKARNFIDFIFQKVVASESTLSGDSHLREAIREAESGANILILQNHRSGADTAVFETLVWRELGSSNVTRNWDYIAGHIVNIYIIPLLFTGGLNRYQIYSMKNQEGKGVIQSASEISKEMRAQNVRAMRALAENARYGGKITILYPEGGRGDNGLKRGEPHTVCIPKLISRSKYPLLVLPTYVDGAASILPVRRGNNEFNEVLDVVQLGKADVRIGPMISWDRLVQTCGDNDTHLCDEMMSHIAKLAPSPDEMGPYASEPVRTLVEEVAS